MGKRDGTYSLSVQTELDNAFITALIPDGQKDEPLRRGAGSQKQSKVFVMSESEFVENPCQGKKTGLLNHIKMRIISDMRADTVTNIVKEQIDFQAELTTDGSTSRNKLGEHVKSHDALVVKHPDWPKILPRVHVAIGNLKRLLLYTHHQLKKEYLKYYLNEFCYKFNRRYCGEKLFDGLVKVAVTWTTDF
ncbi:hypothetical protein EZS27_026157 [termite gut metagenome]|uniref:ISXO2-like transposase domain-containing protein n=1 Tax=termite gut metagenome TaxID=433724 RepID=A0A5J4QRN8_9ZZZZ